MVLKKSKFGGNTGNTLRKSSLVSGKVRPTAFVETKCRRKTPSLFQEQPIKTWLNDGSLIKGNYNSINNNNSVHYSLNKDKRWYLYEDITTQLQENKQYSGDKEDKVKQRSKRKAHLPTKESVAVVLKPGDWLPLSSTRRDCTKSFHDSNDTHPNFERNSWRSPSNHEEEGYDKAYIFKQGFPSKTFPELTSKIPNLNTPDKVSLKKSNKQFRNFPYGNKDDYDLYFEYDNYWYDDDEVYDDVDNSVDFYYEEVNQSPVTKKCGLLDFVKEKHCKTQFERTPLKNNERENNLSKSHVKFIVREPFFHNADDEESEVPHKVFENSEPPPTFTVKVKTDQILAARLQEKYESCYIEGDSKSRCFAIFSNVQAEIKVLFECVCYEDDDTFLSVKVFSEDSVELVNDLNTSTYIDFDTLVELLFPDHSINQPAALKSPVVTNKLSADKLKNYLSTCHIQEILLQNVCNHTPAPTDYMQDEYEFDYVTVCTVCLEESPMKKLNNCGHMFCDNCWKKYMETKILLGNSSISCLDFECEENIGFLTIMKYLPKKLFSSYYKQLCSHLILKNPSLKMCPNENCQHVAIGNDTVFDELNDTKPKGINKDIPIVKCACKKLWCFECQNEAHWPVACHVRDKYEQQFVNVLYDKSGRAFETTISYRTCPHCKSKIVKNGGCPFMACICGRNFCWRCLKPYDNHSQCTAAASDKSHVFSSLADETISQSKSARIFRNALRHRVARSQISPLKRMLKISKMQNKLVIDAPENSLLATTAKAFNILHECYEIMENLSLVFADNSRGNYKAKKLLDSLFWFSYMLWENLDVQNMSEINLQLLENQLTFIRVLLRKLKDL